jgi:cardiolipin synthase
MLNLPNILTISRLAVLPVILVLLIGEPDWGARAIWFAFALYVLACITDYLDGWLARKLNQKTDLGTFLDPISDKIFIAALFIVMAVTERIFGVWALAAVLILAREFMVSGLREYLGPKNIQLPVTQMAKWKTTSQMLATGLLMIGPLYSGR